MLASSSSDLSGTFWSAAAVVVALAAILVAVLIWRLGPPRCLLLYSLDSDTALLSSHARARAAGAELQIILGGQELSDPHFVSLQIASYGRRDIRVDDFSEARPLVLDLAAPILKVLASDMGGDKMPEVMTTIDGSRVMLGPGLIKRRQLISLDLLTDGPVTLTCPRPPLADVTIRERVDETGEPRWLKWGASIAGLVFVAAVTLVGIGQAHHIVLLREVGSGVGVGVVVVLPLLAVVGLAILTVRNRRLPGGRRQPPRDRRPAEGRRRTG